jgi:hypothetical protein
MLRPILKENYLCNFKGWSMALLLQPHHLGVYKLGGISVKTILGLILLILSTLPSAYAAAAEEDERCLYVLERSGPGAYECWDGDYMDYRSDGSLACVNHEDREGYQEGTGYEPLECGTKDSIVNFLSAGMLYW